VQIRVALEGTRKARTRVGVLSEGHLGRSSDDVCPGAPLAQRCLIARGRDRLSCLLCFLERLLEVSLTNESFGLSEKPIRRERLFLAGRKAWCGLRPDAGSSDGYGLRRRLRSAPRQCEDDRIVESPEGRRHIRGSEGGRASLIHNLRRVYAEGIDP
jgi:hypothetical protein